MRRAYLLFRRRRYNFQFSLLGLPEQLLSSDLELGRGLVLDLGLLRDLPGSGEAAQLLLNGCVCGHFGLFR